MACAPMTSRPGVKTERIVSLSATAGGSASEPSAWLTRPSQKNVSFWCSEKSGGLLREMILPPPRLGPKPMPRTPSESVRPSPVENSGRWHVAHETPSLPERTLSKKSAWPSANISSETVGGAGSGWMPAPKSSSRNASTRRSATSPPPPEEPLLQPKASKAKEQTNAVRDERDIFGPPLRSGMAVTEGVRCRDLRHAGHDRNPGKQPFGLPRRRELEPFGVVKG